jgi:hypothetical protein
MIKLIYVLLIIFIAIGIGCHNSNSNTKFGLKYNEHAFRLLKEGDSLENALASVGPPLLIKEWKEHDAGKVIDATSLSEFKHLDCSYLLVYSMQINGRKDFERRSLLIVNGVIASIADETVDE